MQVQYGAFEQNNSFCMQKAYTGNACGPIHLNVYLLIKNQIKTQKQGG